MISVLIPTYNYNAFSLVEEIHKQLVEARISFEIICLDDGSQSEINKNNNQINSLSFSSFDSLKKNIGRSAIRNLLAQKATFDWLLFLDSDVFPARKNFIYNYLLCAQQDNVIFCGGITYKNSEHNKRLLRYKFGKIYEEVSVQKRNLNAEKYFFTSNFFIRKDIFELLKFDEKLLQYGREDFLFSFNLKKKGVEIMHIENEVFHLGLDTNDVFVSKTKKAMENLIFIEKNNLIHKNNILLLKVIDIIDKIKMTFIIGKFHIFFEELSIKKSSVFYLNCMKLSYLSYLKIIK